MVMTLLETRGRTYFCFEAFQTIKEWKSNKAIKEEKPERVFRKHSKLLKTEKVIKLVKNDSIRVRAACKASLASGPYLHLRGKGVESFKSRPIT